MSGAINQILNYKEELQKQFYELAKNNEREFDVFNPKSIIIIGSLEFEKLENCQVLEKLNHFLLLVKEKFLIKLLVNLAGV